jgi:hypothetical protein
MASDTRARARPHDHSECAKSARPQPRGLAILFAVEDVQCERVVGRRTDRVRLQHIRTLPELPTPSAMAPNRSERAGATDTAESGCLPALARAGRAASLGRGDSGTLTRLKEKPAAQASPSRGRSGVL